MEFVMEKVLVDLLDVNLVHVMDIEMDYHLENWMEQLKGIVLD